MSIVDNMPAADYFAVDAASNSFLKGVLRSPAHAMAGKDRKPSRAMEIGTAIHTAILEPDVFAANYLIAPCQDRVSALYKGLAKDAGSHRVLTIPEHENVIGMQSAVYANKRAASILKSNGRRELSVFATDPITGVAVKCRFDFKGDGFLAADLKKTQDARGFKFSKSISDYGYYMQIAFYSDVWEWATGEKIKEFPIIAVEENAPHGCIVHDLDEVALILGRKHYREALNIYADCKASGIWRGYEDDSEVTSVTNWLAGELMDDAGMGGFDA